MIGAIANSEQDASQLQLPVTLIAILPAILLPSVLNDPAATSSVALSWIPMFAPVVFIGRYVLGASEAWEIPVVFAIQLATIVLVAWIGGRIFRVGLLMTGVRPTVREIARWVRHG